MSIKVELIRIHEFQWSLLSIAPWNTFKQKILEAYFIMIIEPSLNSQMNTAKNGSKKWYKIDTQSQMHCKQSLL